MPRHGRDRHLSCITYQDNGRLCRVLASILDPKRGGMVCRRHDPARDDRFTWTEDDAVSLKDPEEEGR